MVFPQSLPLTERETRAGRRHRAHNHAGQQLVQEPQAERPRRRGQGEVTSSNFYSYCLLQALKASCM